MASCLFALGRRAARAAGAVGVAAAAAAAPPALPGPAPWKHAPREDAGRRPRAGPRATLRCEEAPRLRCGTCVLKDGRRLAYHEEGEGLPVVAFHGMGSSRLTWLGQRPLRSVCPGVRLIAVDRPGYGGSSPPPAGYSYSAFARDVEELAEWLRLPRFAVAGHSSGGPYALATAAALPGRVVACAAISSDAPYCHPLAPASLRAADSFAESVAASPLGCYGRDLLGFVEDMRASALQKGDPVKAHAWKCGVSGWLLDFTLERLPWSFAVEGIVLGPRLTVWVGGEDIEAISIGATFLHQLVPGAQLRVVEGGDHGFKSKPEHLASILQELKAQFGGQ